jgi:hypothetical protein
MRLNYFILILLTSLSLNLFGQIKVLNGGRVGIGTNDVTLSKLHVFGENYTMPLLLTTTTEDYGYSSAIRTQSSWVKNLVVVQRPTQFTNWGNENFIVYSCGEVWANNQYLTSDNRLKKSIKKIESPIQLINKINGYYFQYKQPLEMDSSLKSCYSGKFSRASGFLAQELIGIFPEAVDTNSNGIFGVSYHSLIPLLVEGIKSQQQEISELKEEVENLKFNSNFIDKSASLSELKTLQFKVYPNPSNGLLNIEILNSEQIGEVAILLTDLSGTLKEQKLINLKNKSEKITFDVKQHKTGLYFVSILSDSKVIFTEKVLINN